MRIGDWSSDVCSSDLCRGEAKAGTCLTQEQVEAARKIYAGPKHARTGEQLYPGYPFGSEGVVPDAHATRPGWSGYWSETANPGEPSRADMFRYWVFNDPKWNWWTFDWAADVDAMHRRLAPIFEIGRAACRERVLQYV